MVDQSQRIETLKNRVRMLELRRQRILLALGAEGNTPAYRVQLRVDLVKINAQILDLKIELGDRTAAEG